MGSVLTPCPACYTLPPWVYAVFMTALWVIKSMPKTCIQYLVQALNYKKGQPGYRSRFIWLHTLAYTPKVICLIKISTDWYACWAPDTILSTIDTSVSNKVCFQETHIPAVEDISTHTHKKNSIVCLVVTARRKGKKTKTKTKQNTRNVTEDGYNFSQMVRVDTTD